MAQSILELAKYGEPEAIASLLNRSIQPKGITATANLEGECLNISLHSTQTPNQQALLALIQKGMVALQVPSIKKLLISAYKTNGDQLDYLLWQAELDLQVTPINDKTEEQQEKPMVSPSMNFNFSGSSSEPVEKTEEKVDTQSFISSQTIQIKPAEIALVHQPVQLKQIPSEYQDIIIRFIDPNYGRIKCLCTLTELVEAINSFSLALAAAAPDLHNLLEVIAESSVTDDNGDRLIINVSVLQPGSQWQKAQIRIALKILFEAAQYSPNISTKPEQVITLDVVESESTPEKHEGDDLDLEQNSALTLDDLSSFW